MRRSVLQAFAWSVVEHVHSIIDLIITDFGEVRSFGCRRRLNIEPVAQFSVGGNNFVLESAGLKLPEIAIFQTFTAQIQRRI